MSGSVTPAPLPSAVLLESYARDGGYVDCYAADVSGAVDLPRFIAAFYASRAFLPERWLLGVLLNKWAGADDIAALADGRSDSFAAWTVEARRPDEILLRDFQGRTRSWLMVRALHEGTRLHFGSAVVPTATRSAAFRALRGFHGHYSVALLRGAVKQLQR